MAGFRLPLPGVVPGNYKAIVRSDIRNNLVEGNETNNLKASLDRFATDAPALVLGTPTLGSITTNQSLYYKVTVPAGETVVVEFDSNSEIGSTELYMSYESMPRRSRADLNALKPFQTDQRIVISSTQAGTYYILAYGSDVTAPSSSFSILARIVPFTVFDSNFGQGGTSGNRTILIDGAKFDRSVTATLVDSQGRTFPAVSYTRVNETRLYATFGLRDAAIAKYSLRFSKGSTGEQILIANAFEVVFSVASVQPISLTGPDSFNRRRNDRPPAIIPVALGWRNNTLNDVAVPLIHFSSTDPFATTLEDAKLGRTVTSYRVELIGDTPQGFTLESNGTYRFRSSETVAFVVHYDLVLKDLQSRVGRLFGAEIRSRGVLAITLKNNFTRDIHALDPNDIIGPLGYGADKWVLPEWMPPSAMSVGHLQPSHRQQTMMQRTPRTAFCH